MNRKMEISARLRMQVAAFIRRENLIEEGDTILVGVSGGADSVCLLFLLLELRDELKIKLKALHVEHGIRGESSLEDMRFVEKLCKENNIPLEIVRVEALTYAKENSLSLEEAARILRYRAFADATKGHEKIAVAHHGNDQAETVLFQTLRGSGIRGVSGMRPQRDQIIRPLLCLTKDDIWAYITEKGLPYREDETNTDATYSRNYIRAEIIPRLEALQPRSVEHLMNLADDAREVTSYLHRQAAPIYQKTAQETAEAVSLNLSELMQEEKILWKEVIRIAISKVLPTVKDVTRIHMEETIRLIMRDGDGEIHLPKGVKIIKAGNRLRVQKGDCEQGDFYREPVKIETDKSTILADGTMIETRLIPYRKGLEIPRNTYTKWFDYDKIRIGLLARSRQPKDYLCIDSLQHKQKLQDYMVNNKIPNEEKDRLLLIADGEEVVWIVGHRISETYKITEKTTQIIEVIIAGGNYE